MFTTLQWLWALGLSILSILIYILIKKSFDPIFIAKVRSSPSSCPGPNNLPPLQFHSVHGDNIRISRDGTLARRFESFCRAITFSARPVRINERICVKFAETSNNWNGGIRFGFTTNDPATLENALPKYACPDLTNRPGFWAKALHEQYCEKDNILYYYVNSAGDVIYGINNEEKGVILSGIDTRGLLWTLIDIYGNCTAIEFLDSRVDMYQEHSMNGGMLGNGMSQTSLMSANGLAGPTGPQIPMHANMPHQQSRRSLPTGAVIEQEMDRHLMPSMQSLNLAADHTGMANDIANGLPPLRYNVNGRLIPVPFHITKGRNVLLSHDRFIATRTVRDFCQGYVFTARPLRIGEKVIVQILKAEQIYFGALALGLTSCNPASLQPADLPNDSDFLLDRPEYWVISKDIASAAQRGDEIAFFVASNGEVSISKNNGPAVVVMHVDQSLQLWAFLDVYGSTQSVRMFRQQLPNLVQYPAQSQQLQQQQLQQQIQEIQQHEPVSTTEMVDRVITDYLASVLKVPPTQRNVTHSSLNASSSTLASRQSHSLANLSRSSGLPANTTTTTTTTSTQSGHMISVPSSCGADMIQIQPNGGGTVLVVNLPPTTSSHDLSNSLTASQACINQTTNNANNGILAGACSSTTILSNASSQYIEPLVNTNNAQNQKWKDSIDQQNADTNNAGAECTICYENQIDSVLYMCGHMCMCYDCALEQWRGVGGGQCPLCRAVIRDVIRTYTT